MNNAQKNRVNFMQQTTDLELRGRAHVGRARSARPTDTFARGARQTASTSPILSHRRIATIRVARGNTKIAEIVVFHAGRVGENNHRKHASTGMLTGDPIPRDIVVRNCRFALPLSANRFEQENGADMCHGKPAEEIELTF